MGAMKRLNQWRRVDGVQLSQPLRVLAGLEPPRETREERAERKALEAEAAAEAKAEREAIQAVEAEAAEARAARWAARLVEWRAEVGRPIAPQASTGFYSCEGLPGAYFPVGTGPWPDFRYPGLAWDRAWKQPRPDGVPWADELPPPRVFAADPRPIRETVGKVQQGRLF